MTIQDQIKNMVDHFEILRFEVYNLKDEFDKSKDQITDTSKKPKPTHYYPNGAYMDEPEMETEYFYISEFLEEILCCRWTSHVMHRKNLERQNCFPTQESAEKELNRQKLTAKMYRDMRDERINGDWVADWSDEEQYKHEVYIDDHGNLDTLSWTVDGGPHDFYFKNKTFISDLKALGWTEEELKIVWFRV